MEGLTILYSSQEVAGHGFNSVVFWICLVAFILLGFGISIPVFIYELSNVRKGVAWGCFCGTMISIFGALMSLLFATMSAPVYETHYACTIDYNVIDQDEFENTYEIVEQKDRMYIIREREIAYDND